MNKLLSIPIQLYADGADKQGILDLYREPYIQGLTTNPTLMRRAGISDYEAFAKDILVTVTEKPISFEVFSDDFAEMRRQALKIAAWQENVYVKIPITNTHGQSSLSLIRELSLERVKLNVTAILTLAQVRGVSEALSEGTPAIVSVFAGRIADTGVDPEPIMRASAALISHLPGAQLLWASVREVYNVFQAANSDCEIITVPHAILGKLLSLYHSDLEQLSLDTVRMFARDAIEAGFSL